MRQTVRDTVVDALAYLGAYRDRMQKLTKTLRDRCGSHGIDWVDVDVAQGVLPVLTGYLTKRAKLF